MGSCGHLAGRDRAFAFQAQAPLCAVPGVATLARDEGHLRRPIPRSSPPSRCPCGRRPAGRLPASSAAPSTMRQCARLHAYGSVPHRGARRWNAKSEGEGEGELSAPRSSAQPAGPCDVRPMHGSNLYLRRQRGSRFCSSCAARRSPHAADAVVAAEACVAPLTCEVINTDPATVCPALNEPTNVVTRPEP